MIPYLVDFPYNIRIWVASWIIQWTEYNLNFCHCADDMIHQFFWAHILYLPKNIPWKDVKTNFKTTFSYIIEESTDYVNEIWEEEG